MHIHLEDFYSHCAFCEAVLREVSIAPAFALYKSLLKSLTIFQLIVSPVESILSHLLPHPHIIASFLLSPWTPCAHVYLTCMLHPFLFPLHVFLQYETLLHCSLTHPQPASICALTQPAGVFSPWWNRGGSRKPLTDCFPHLPHPHISKKRDGGHEGRYFIT